MDNISLWMATTKKTKTYPRLEKDLKVDVAIIGAGITGITAAMELIAAGKSVAVVESHTVGSGTTGFSTGNLYIPVQPYYQNIVKKFDLNTAKSVAQARNAAIDYIESKVKEINIACHFSRRPWFLLTNDATKVEFLKNEIEVLKKINVNVEDAHDISIPLKFRKAALIPKQARLNPMQYVVSIAEFLSDKGCHIFEQTPVLSIAEEKDICRLHTSAGDLIADKVFIATHTPIGINPVQAFTAPYRSYVVAVQEPNHIYPEGQWWDLDDPHHALCTHPNHGTEPDLLLVAGSHHKTGQGYPMMVHYQKLTTYLHSLFPSAKVAYRWSAQHYQSADDIPYIGLSSRFAKNTYMATGFFADGLVYGTMAGIIVANLIAQGSNALSETFNANRFKPMASAPFVLKENANVFLQYLKDYPFQSQANFDDIKKGEGKVVEVNREKWAVCRDEQNQLHMLSAVCTHMKCIVNWNDAEKTWDCPCHGSRFTQQGNVIEGPAMRDLEKKDI